MASPLYFPKFRAFDANGNPLAGGKVYTYAAGTSTLLSTYTTAELNTAHANPVELDANGEASIFLGPYSYKVVLKNAAEATQWTVDWVTPEGSSTVQPSYVPNVNLLDNGGFEIQGNANRPSVNVTGSSAAMICDRWWAYRSTTGHTTGVGESNGLPGLCSITRAEGNANAAGIIVGQELGYLGVGQPSASDLINAILNPITPGIQSRSLVFSAYLQKGANLASNVVLEIVSATSSRNIVTGTWTVDASVTITPSQLSSTAWTRFFVTKTGAFAANTKVLGVRVRTADYTGTAGANDSAIFTGAKLELSTTSAPTDYIIPTQWESTERCRRFYRKFGDADAPLNLSSYGAAGQTVTVCYPLSPPMAKTPTATVNGTWTVSNCGQPTVGVSAKGFSVSTTVTGLGAFSFSAGTDDTITLDAETA